MAPEPGGLARIGRVDVVMPAHDEERHLERALCAIQAAAAALERRRPGTDVGITVVLDHCTDRSAEVVSAFAGLDRRITVLSRRFRNAGASRAAGVAAALLGRQSSLEKTWLASTDADSCVPDTWLWRHLEFADAGWDVVLGSVEPDPGGMDPEVLRRWRARHPFGEDHPHVYGANLGVRASAYLHAGGFPEIRSAEDRILAERLRRRGFAVVAPDTIRVVTSGRTAARAPRGFGAYLRTIGVEAAAALRSG